MKTSFTLLILLTSMCTLFAQGTLQFNQVKLINSNETVPAGKVWKLEGASYNGGSPFQSGVTNYSHVFSANRGFDAIMRFQVNGFSILLPAAYITNTSGGNSGSIPNYTFPMWLPAGTILAPQTNIVYLNVIEFNVIP